MSSCCMPAKNMLACAYNVSELCARGFLRHSVPMPWQCQKKKKPIRNNRPLQVLSMVRAKGFEPPLSCAHQVLNLARLPITPRTQNSSLFVVLPRYRLPIIIPINKVKGKQQPTPVAGNLWKPKPMRMGIPRTNNTPAMQNPRLQDQTTPQKIPGTVSGVSPPPTVFQHAGSRGI